MHTLTLITVDIPDTTEIKVPDDGIRRLVEAVFGQETDVAPGNIYAELIRKRLNCRRDAFSVAVDNAVANAIKRPVSHAVIASPHEEVQRLLALSASRMKKKEGTK